jgi:hypothetical protein
VREVLAPADITTRLGAGSLGRRYARTCDSGFGTGEKDTSLGAGQGGFSFELELNRKIVVRRNHAGYASGVQHDDLMVIYLDAPNGALEGKFELAAPGSEYKTYLSWTSKQD